ncbi:MAG: alanine racemase [Actinomycetota bacterium]|jgi:alanine racemase
MNAQRWAWAQIDLDALRHNVSVLATHIAPQQLWAVVKADAYGHGAIECARVALQSGAQGLCVALVQEGIELRQAGINAPILIMSEQPADQHRDIISYGLIATLYNETTITEFARTAHDLEIMASVHVKVDTGMHRVGAPSVEAVKVAKLVADSQWLSLEGMFTHLATADVAETQFAQQQVSAFSRSVEQVRALGIEVRHVHVSNSASAIRKLDAGAGCTMARVGIALYGIPGDAHTNSFGAEHKLDLRSVMSVRARVSHVQRVTAGQGVSYGLKRPMDHDSTVATLPLGYADGVPRGLWESGSVLIGGVRRSFAGVVTMDQIMVNCANDEVSIGDEVVLIGAQGSERVTANEWANKMGTIGYEIVCAISARMPRNYIN